MIEALRLEYLQCSKDLYRLIQKNNDQKQVEALKSHINDLLIKIKQGDNVKPEDLISD